MPTLPPVAPDPTARVQRIKPRGLPNDVTKKGRLYAKEKKKEQEEFLAVGEPGVSLSVGCLLCFASQRTGASLPPCQPALPLAKWSGVQKLFLFQDLGFCRERLCGLVQKVHHLGNKHQPQG
jgi:hypothetical protein